MNDSATNQTLIDSLAIQTVKAVYCEGADSLPIDTTKATALLKETFVEDAKADYGTGIIEGRISIINFLVNEVSVNRDWVYHCIHTPNIAINGNVALAKWTISASMKAKGSRTVETAIGRYSDDLIRTPDGWRISYVRWIEEVRQ